MATTARLPDGTELELEDGATGADAAQAIGPGLARAALAIEVSDPEGGPAEFRDLSRPLPGDAAISVITERSGAPALELILMTPPTCWRPRSWRSTWASSLDRPADRGASTTLRLPAGHLGLRGRFPSHRRADARPHQGGRAVRAPGRPGGRGARAVRRAGAGLQGRADRYLAAAAPPGDPLRTVSLYTNGPFTDLCRGPHAPSTATVKAFKLNSLAGAYWRGDSTRTMLTRIYGTVLLQGRTGRAPGASRVRQGARPPQTRARARAVRLLGGFARRRLLDAGRDAHLQRAGGGVAANGRRTRLHRGRDAPDLRLGLWKTSGLGQVSREHVHPGRSRIARWRSSRRTAPGTVSCSR